MKYAETRVVTDSVGCLSHLLLVLVKGRNFKNQWFLIVCMWWFLLAKIQTTIRLSTANPEIFSFITQVLHKNTMILFK